MNKANSADTEAQILDLNLSISNFFLFSYQNLYKTKKTKINKNKKTTTTKQQQQQQKKKKKKKKKKRDDFDIINFLYLDGEVFYISQVIGVQECLIISLISMLVTKIWLPNFSNRGIEIINGKAFPKFYPLH